MMLYKTPKTMFRSSGGDTDSLVIVDGSLLLHDRLVRYIIYR